MLSGYKTYISAVGMLAFGIYQITEGNIDAGIQAIIGALAIFGVGHKIEKKVAG